jgi:hypothetical protein
MYERSIAASCARASCDRPMARRRFRIALPNATSSGAKAWRGDERGTPPCCWLDANSTTDDHPQMKMQSTRRQPLPLCAGYFGVMLDRLDLHQHGDDGQTMCRVHWAIGLLADGELERLGAWLSPCDDAGSEQRAFAELRDRGVETIRFVIGHDRAVTRVDASAAYPRSRMLASFEALLRECLLQVAPSHRRAVGSVLRSAITADSLDSAHDALDSFASSAVGHRYSALADRWHSALLDAEPFFALSARQRRMLSLGDALARDIHGRLRRSLSRRGALPSSASVSALVDVALARIGHRLPKHKTTLGSDVVGHSGRPVTGALAASP